MHDKNFLKRNGQNQILRIIKIRSGYAINVEIEFL